MAVTDTGAGTAPNDVDKIIDRDYCGRNIDVSASGIGVVLVKDAGQCAGSIFVASTPHDTDRGTRFNHHRLAPFANSTSGRS